MPRSCPPSEDSRICRGVASWGPPPSLGSSLGLSLSACLPGPLATSPGVGPQGLLASTWPHMEQAWPQVPRLQPPPAIPRSTQAGDRKCRGWDVGRGWRAASPGMASWLVGPGNQGFIPGQGGQGGEETRTQRRWRITRPLSLLCLPLNTFPLSQSLCLSLSVSGLVFL